MGGVRAELPKVDDEMLGKLLSNSGCEVTGICRGKSVFMMDLGLVECLVLSTYFLFHCAALSRTSVRITAVASLTLSFHMISKANSRLGIIKFSMFSLPYLLARGALRSRKYSRRVAGMAVMRTFFAVFCAFIMASFFVRRLGVIIWGGGTQQASSNARKSQIAKGLPHI